MPDVRAFRGLLYSSESRDVTPLVAPPYDVLDESRRDAYLQKSPFNVVHADLPPKRPEDQSERDRYERAKQTYEGWLKDRALAPSPEEALYLAVQTYSLGGAALTRVGVVGLVDALSLQQGGILPHERTFEGPKKDRLELLRSLEAHLSQIFLLYRGEGDPTLELWESIGKDAYIREALDADGTLHRLYPIEDPAAIGRIRAFLSKKRMYVADGHHRLETALTYAKERIEAGAPLEGAHRYTLAFLCNMDQPGLKILGYHRLLKPSCGQDIEERLTKAGFALTGLDEAVTPEAIETALLDSKLRYGFSFGLIEKDANRLTLKLATLPQERHRAFKEGLAQEGLDESVASLDVALVDRYVLGEILRLDDTTKKEHIAYEPDLRKVIGLIEAQTLKAGILLNPLSPEEVIRVSEASQKMPQKSTYFYPKLLTGLVVYDLNRSF